MSVDSILACFDEEDLDDDSHTEERVLQAQKRVTLSSSHCEMINKNGNGLKVKRWEKVGGPGGYGGAGRKGRRTTPVTAVPP